MFHYCEHVLLQSAFSLPSSSDPPPPFFLKGGESILNASPRGGRNLKKFKKGWKYGVGAGFFKRLGEGEGGLALFLFNSFKVYHFYMEKLLYPLQNCVMHLKKIIFFSAIIIF